MEEGATLPTKGSPGSAGHDLYSNSNLSLLPDQIATVSTGIGLILPANHFAKIEDRSGLAAHHHLLTAAGVIDQDYEGVVKVVIRNMSSRNVYLIRKGDRIAQMVVHQIPNTVAELQPSSTSTERGAGGFGSTGR